MRAGWQLGEILNVFLDCFNSKNLDGGKTKYGFPGGTSGKDPTCRRHKRHGLNP